MLFSLTPGAEEVTINNNIFILIDQYHDRNCNHHYRNDHDNNNHDHHDSIYHGPVYCYLHWSPVKNWRAGDDTAALCPPPWII